MLERTDAITNEVLEPITFVLAYPSVCVCVCVSMYVHIYNIFYTIYIIFYLFSIELLREQFYTYFYKLGIADWKTPIGKIHNHICIYLCFNQGICYINTFKITIFMTGAPLTCTLFTVHILIL
jgi:hypothetical protein